MIPWKCNSRINYLSSGSYILPPQYTFETNCTMVFKILASPTQEDVAQIFPFKKKTRKSIVARGLEQPRLNCYVRYKTFILSFSLVSKCTSKREALLVVLLQLTTFLTVFLINQLIVLSVRCQTKSVQVQVATFILSLFFLLIVRQNTVRARTPQTNVLQGGLLLFFQAAFK